MTLHARGRRLAIMLTLSLLGAGLTISWLGEHTAAQTKDDIFIITSAAKEPDAVVSAIKSYAQEKKWQYLGDSKIRQGQITLVKICIPEVGQALWPAGLHLSAMLPCGNIGVYKKDGVTEISTLHPRYMQVLSPSKATEGAATIAAPLLTAMLKAVTD